MAATCEISNVFSNYFSTMYSSEDPNLASVPPATTFGADDLVLALSSPQMPLEGTEKASWLGEQPQLWSKAQVLDWISYQVEKHKYDASTIDLSRCDMDGAALCRCAPEELRLAFGPLGDQLYSQLWDLSESWRGARLLLRPLLNQGSPFAQEMLEDCRQASPFYPGSFGTGAPSPGSSDVSTAALVPRTRPRAFWEDRKGLTLTRPSRDWRFSEPPGLRLRWKRRGPGRPGQQALLWGCVEGASWSPWVFPWQCSGAGPLPHPLRVFLEGGCPPAAPKPPSPDLPPLPTDGFPDYKKGDLKHGKRKRGRPRKLSKDSREGTHLWEFIRDILIHPELNEGLMKWENRQEGVFKFLRSEAVAQLWGQKKKNSSMTYEKLSRAMRYYYKREILERVDGRRLVYKFGKNSSGWKEEE
ncbi:hypothetical protein E2I00_010383, partial [Balaenoptera physalus]